MGNQWSMIEARAREKAAQLGHVVPERGFHGSRTVRDVRTAMCDRCGGCCWVATVPDGPPRWRKACGGRLLFYACGTPEAAGLVRQEGDALLPGGDQNYTGIMVNRL